MVVFRRFQTFRPSLLRNYFDKPANNAEVVPLSLPPPGAFQDGEKFASAGEDEAYHSQLKVHATYRESAVHFFSKRTALSKPLAPTRTLPCFNAFCRTYQQVCRRTYSALSLIPCQDGLAGNASGAIQAWMNTRLVGRLIPLARKLT